MLCKRWRILALQRRPTGAGVNRLVLRWLKTVVVSDREKAHKMRQVGTRKTCQKRLGRGYPGGRRC